MLVGGAQAAVQGEDLRGREVAAADRVLRVPDLVLPGEEHEHVAVALAGELVECVVDALQVVPVVGRVSLGIFRHLRDERPVPDLDGECTPRHLDDGGTVEVLREALGVDGGRRDDDLELGPAGEQLLEVPEQEVDRQRPLVRLVDDDRVVLLQVAVAVDLVEEDPVSHELDAGVFAHFVGEPHLVADERAELGAKLLGDAFGDRACRDPSRLGVPDGGVAKLKQHLGQLRGLTRAGRPRNDDHLVVADGVADVIPALADGQPLGVSDEHRGDGEGRSLRI